MDNEQLYNLRWREWVTMKEIGPMSRIGRRLVFRELARLNYSSLLDVGCGPGVFLAEVSRRRPICTLGGVDISAEGIALAKSRNPKAGFQVIDITKKIPSGCFDVVTMLDVAEHISDDFGAFCNLRPACRKALVVMTLEGRMRQFEHEVGHVRNYRPGELPEKLERAGYSLSRYLHWGWPLFSPVYRDLSDSIGAHRHPASRRDRLMARLGFMVLSLSWPHVGDVTIAVAHPRIDHSDDFARNPPTLTK